VKSPKEHPSSCVYKIYLRQWKMSYVMDQSLPRTFRKSVWDVDVCIVISLLKISGKYMCTCCDIKELRTLPGSVGTCVSYNTNYYDINHIIFLKTLSWSL